MNSGNQNVEKLLAEAEKHIQQINSDGFEAMQEEHRLQFEFHAQKCVGELILKKL